jgi:hypothetical protein
MRLAAELLQANASAADRTRPSEVAPGPKLSFAFLGRRSFSKAERPQRTLRERRETSGADLGTAARRCREEVPLGMDLPVYWPVGHRAVARPFCLLEAQSMLEIFIIK